MPVILKLCKIYSHLVSLKNSFHDVIQHIQKRGLIITSHNKFKHKKCLTDTYMQLQNQQDEKFFLFLFFLICKGRIEDSLKETQFCFNNKNPIQNRQYYTHSQYFNTFFLVLWITFPNQKKKIKNQILKTFLKKETNKIIKKIPHTIIRKTSSFSEITTQIRKSDLQVKFCIFMILS